MPNKNIYSFTFRKSISFFSDKKSNQVRVKKLKEFDLSDQVPILFTICIVKNNLKELKEMFEVLTHNQKLGLYELTNKFGLAVAMKVDGFDIAEVPSREILAFLREEANNIKLKESSFQVRLKPCSLEIES